MKTTSQPNFQTPSNLVEHQPASDRLYDVPVSGFERFDLAFQQILTDLLENGAVIASGTSKSIGADKKTREILNYSFQLRNLQERLLTNLKRPLNLTGALGRFLWMMAGSDRLAEIEYYEPKVRYFSDDGITVPGSNYGTRLLEPRPGVNQVTNIIQLLKEQLHTRRAAATIYQPEDSGRDSKDIPCTFGLIYNLRNDRLHATTIMRSNNAWVLLPYNVFEFTLLAEVIAAEVGVEVGTYHHFAASMHLYENDFSAANAAARETISGNPIAMPPVPRESPWKNLQALLKFEIKLRSKHSGLTKTTFRAYVNEARGLGIFWSDLALILVVHALRMAERLDLCEQVLNEVPPPFRQLLDGYYGPLFQNTRT